MARLAGVVIPGLPHHVTQRGNGRARLLFQRQPCAAPKLVAESCGAADIEVRALRFHETIWPCGTTHATIHAR
jgi:putative transposase